MRRRTYIPKMGQKKAAPRPVNYVKGKPNFERMLKEWYVRHKEYYANFKEKLEEGIVNEDPKIVDVFKQCFSLFPTFRSKSKEDIAKMLTSMSPKRFEDYEWDNKKDVVNWVTNDFDATVAEHTRVLSPENLPAWRKLFVEDGMDDCTIATLYWFMLDDGQITMLMALNNSMDKEDLTDRQLQCGKLMTRGVIEKGILTGCFHKTYWEKIFSLNGCSRLKDTAASVLSTTKGKGGRNADILILREIVNGPDKDAILKNLKGVVTTRTKDTDLACLLMLLVRTGNVDENIKYKPFHDAIKSEFPDAGIGTERRPQQLYNNLTTNPMQMLTINTRKRCQKRMDEMREQLGMA